MMPQRNGVQPENRWQRTRRSFWSLLTDEAVLIYRRSAVGKDRARILLVESFLFVREVIRDFLTVHGTARASALAYATLLSLVPLLVAFSQILRSYFAKIFPDFQSQIDTLLNVVLPYQSAQISYHLNRFAENAEAASALGAVAFLLISFRLFMAVEGSVNAIWKVPSSRGYRQKIRAFTMLIFWGPILIGLSFTTSASLQRNPYLTILFSDTMLMFVPVIVLFIAFTMLFWLVPSTKVQLKAAMLGAVVTTVLFQLVRYGFGTYLQTLFAGRLNVIYGTLGLVILFLIALEVMWVVILLGVQISYVYQNLQGVLRASEQQLEENPRFDLYFAIRALTEIARRFERREEAPSSYRLAEDLGATDKQMLRILRKLEGARLVQEIGGDWTGFTPGCDPDRITIDEVVVCLEGGGREIPEPESLDPAKAAVAEIFETMRACTHDAMHLRTIEQIVRGINGLERPSEEVDAAVETR